VLDMEGGRNQDKKGVVQGGAGGGGGQEA
jgi:hypothetical protein